LKFLTLKMCNSAFGLRMHLRLNYLSIFDSVLVLRTKRKLATKAYTPFSDVEFSRESAENHLFFFFLFSDLHRMLGSFTFVHYRLYTFVVWHKILCRRYETILWGVRQILWVIIVRSYGTRFQQWRTEKSWFQSDNCEVKSISVALF